MENQSLICYEILSEEMQQENGGGDDDDDHEMNYVRLLIGQEIASAVLNDQEAAEFMNDIWIQEVRHHAIHYILRTGQAFRFSIQTLYTSVIYVDRFLATRIINVGEYWIVRLLAVTCLSLSAKMDETRENVPQLSHYPVGKFNNVNVIAIRRMELLVLNDLNWDMCYITPFSFTRFFLSRFCRDVSRRYLTRMRTDEIIMSVLRDARLMNHRPSVIAAAATLLAVNRNLTRGELEIEIDALALNGFLQIDNVWYCYFRLLELNERIWG